MGQTFDRSAEDVGNIVALEHVNVKIPSQQVATAFYVVGMGFTRDPYLMVGLENMWINLGQQQFHLPTGAPQVARAHMGLVVPDLDALAARLAAVKGDLEGTAFSCSAENGHLLVTCPWGNRLRCHAPAPRFADMTLGMGYVEFAVPRGHADGIARFYREVMAAPSRVDTTGGEPAARVRVGTGQELIFRETAGPIAPYDGHHIAIYISDFSGPHDWLAEHGLVSEESNPYQYRFERIVDPDTRQELFVIEHEVRSVTHPMYLRPLVNRNPAQRQRTYQRGRDAFVPGMV
jgi:hypothetical protein